MWGKAPHNFQRETSMENRYYHANQQFHNKNLHRSKSPRPAIDVTVIEPVKSAKALSSAPTSQIPVEMPPTPCPSNAQYMTPVFARFIAHFTSNGSNLSCRLLIFLFIFSRNHEGAWRYVVQIPKEGYFTQTVEVTN